MHEDAANADCIGCVGDAHGGIAKQDAAGATTLMSVVDCEAGQDNDGNGSSISRRNRPVAATTETAPEAST
jgi:hypothetical protein